VFELRLEHLLLKSLIKEFEIILEEDNDGKDCF
jgi:hypothetical protein